MKEILSHSQRKYILALLAFFASCGFLWVGKIDASGWQTMILFILGGYFTANIVEKKVVK